MFDVVQISFLPLDQTSQLYKLIISPCSDKNVRRCPDIFSALDPDESVVHTYLYMRREVSNEAKNRSTFLPFLCLGGGWV